MNSLVLIIVGIAGIALGFYIKGRMASPFAPKRDEELDEMREEAREALRERTEKRKEKILYLMNSEVVHDEELKACGVTDVRKGITSENVMKLLDVSGGTARKYLNELEDENKIKQIGKTGRGVYYTLKT